MINLFRYLFLVKEIKSKTGELHFQRWRILWTPWFTLYIHRILKSDTDKKPHNHPCKGFFSFILGGSYREKVWTFRDDDNGLPSKDGTFTCYDTISRKGYEYHKIEIIQPVTSLVLTYGKNPFGWGYYNNGMHCDHEEYRLLKNCGTL